MLEYGIMETSEVTKEVSLCPDCSKPLTPEERLLQAIFSSKTIKCQECYLKSKLPKCTGCGNTINNKVEIYYEDSPYHAQCLPVKSIGVNLGGW